jgi:hypothetical protein
MLIGMAQPGGGPFDQHLSGPGWIDIDLLDCPGGAALPDYCCE